MSLELSLFSCLPNISAVSKFRTDFEQDDPVQCLYAVRWVGWRGISFLLLIRLSTYTNWVQIGLWVNVQTFTYGSVLRVTIRTLESPMQSREGGWSARIDEQCWCSESQYVIMLRRTTLRCLQTHLSSTDLLRLALGAIPGFSSGEFGFVSGGCLSTGCLSTAFLPVHVAARLMLWGLAT